MYSDKEFGIIKLALIVIVIVIFCVANFSDDSSSTSSTSSTSRSNNYSNSSKSYYNNEYSSFTNEYGSPSTICAHPGCTRTIASSGDTNCCTTHSNRCLNCRKYIYEDAAYCMSCLEKAFEKAYGY